MTRGPITVTCTPIDRSTQLLDCTDCGAMGIYGFDETSKIVYDHLIDTHDVNPETITIRNPPEPPTQEP